LKEFCFPEDTEETQGLSAMEIDQLLREKREEILEIAAKHGARNVRIFGSVARGDAGESSDIDLLVDMESGRSLLDRSELIADLQDLLGRKVDIVTEQGIYWLLKRRILKEAHPL
jgi:predicted nucleotidyltransferase